MNFRKIILNAMIFFILAQTTLLAQRTAGSLSIAGFGGAGVMKTPASLKDYYKPNIGFGGEIEYNLTRMTAIEVYLGLQKFECDRAKVKEDRYDVPGVENATMIWDGNAKVSYAGLQLIQHFTPPDFFVGVYVKVGVGTYKITYEDFTLKYIQMFEMEALEKDKSGMGLQGGPGIEIIFNERIRAFIEGKYHHVFTEEEATIFYGIQLGLKITPIF